eukprot:scaffold59449_cov17-Prasinocladus_malaysianus.AAC.1
MHIIVYRFVNCARPGTGTVPDITCDRELCPTSTVPGRARLTFRLCRALKSAPMHQGYMYVKLRRSIMPGRSRQCHFNLYEASHRLRPTAAPIAAA